MPSVVVLAALFLLPAIALGDDAQRDAISKTVIAHSNLPLARGASALADGRIDEGIQLTLEGLQGEDNPRDLAAGYSNLCAGYAALRKWDEALPHCNTSLEIDPESWRAYNNRAAIYTAKGLNDLAMNDLDVALKLAPHAVTVRRSIEIVEQNRKEQRRDGRGSLRT